MNNYAGILVLVISGVDCIMIYRCKSAWVNLHLPNQQCLILGHMFLAHAQFDQPTSVAMSFFFFPDGVLSTRLIISSFRLRVSDWYRERCIAGE